jgi:hypothetical protein
MENAANHTDGCSSAGERDLVSGLLARAVNMEDQISRGVYEDYLDRANWPVRLDENTFVQIRQRLTTLIEDTKQHGRVLQTLVRDHVKSE